MEKIIELTIPEKVIDKSIYYCDICGIDLKEQNTNSWEYNEGKLCYAEGFIYPESDCRYFVEIDICMECMKNKVIPLIKREFGIEARGYDAEY